MKKNIAVDGLTLSHASGSPISLGSFSVTSLPSTVTKENGKGIFITPLLYTFSGGNAPGFVPGSVATLVPQSIISTAQKTKDYGILVIREEDLGTMICQGTIPPPTGGVAPISGNVEISNAGQSKVKAE
jgi:hypothetical protein